MNSDIKTASILPKRSAPRMIEVLRIEKPHPEVKRVVFSGEALFGFPSDMNGSHIKLFFPKKHQVEPQLPTLGEAGPIWPSAIDRPITRTYSVRYYDPLQNQLTVDFACHGHQGPAQHWLNQAKKGQRIGVAGPGGPNPLIHDAKNQIFIGDTSALAAVWALLETPSPHKRHVFLVADHPVGFDQPLHCLQLFKPKDYPTFTALYEHLLAQLRQHLMLNGITQDSDLSAFVAGENELVLSIRDYLKRDYKLIKKRLYAIPYWRLGDDEESYHQTRHQIMDEVY